MRRVFILMMDSFGIGALPDAENFGDVGSNTFGHIAEACTQGKANVEFLRQGNLNIPHLLALGLHDAAKECQQKWISGLEHHAHTHGAYGFAAELSKGKDTPSGHWEITGVPIHFEWGYFPPKYPSFPKELTDAFIKEANLPGVLGNKHSSGTTIIDEFGEESVQTGKPIIYTSADSVFQIAAHEEAFGLERLYEICKIARRLLEPYNIGRVIARPFAGAIGHYKRTSNRKDYSIPPPKPTVLEKLVEAGGKVIGIGKIPDIFAHKGFTQEVVSHDNAEMFNAMLDAVKTAPDYSLTFGNFVDFDMLFGHRRDVAGYAKAIEDFDARLPNFEKLLRPGDLAIITADHGCDPTFKGTDHTREYIPVLVFGPGVKKGSIGKRHSFADIGQTIAEYFDLPMFEEGKSFLDVVFDTGRPR